MGVCTLRTVGQGAKHGTVHTKLLLCLTMAGGGPCGRNEDERRQRVGERGKKLRTTLKLKIVKCVCV